MYGLWYSGTFLTINTLGFAERQYFITPSMDVASTDRLTSRPIKSDSLFSIVLSQVYYCTSEEKMFKNDMTFVVILSG